MRMRTSKARLEAIRLEAGPMMGLGGRHAQERAEDDAGQPGDGGRKRSRRGVSFRIAAMPFSIGVFAAVSVAAACGLEAGPAAALAVVPRDGLFRIEHPTGAAEVVVERDGNGRDQPGRARSVTARKLMDGLVFPAP